MLVYEWLSSLLMNLIWGIRRAIDVKRKGYGDRHTVVEYVDAFLFVGRDREDSDSQESTAPHQLVVILQSQVRNQFLALQMPQRVLQFHQLNKQIMLGIKPRRRHRRLKVKA